MDNIDIEILRVLERDARTSPATIATMLALEESEVRERISNLEASSVIQRYKTVVNWNKVVGEKVLALIEVRVSPQRDVGFDAVAERIYRFPETRTVYLVSGTYDLLVQVAGNTMHEVASFVAEKLSPIEGVQGTVSHFLLRRYKEDGDIFAGEVGSIKRLPLSP